MKTAGVGLAVVLALLGAPCFAAQAVDAPASLPLRFQFEPSGKGQGAYKPALPPSLFVAPPSEISELSIHLPTFQVNSERERETYLALQGAFAEHDMLESCALVKRELPRGRRLEWLCRPEQTSDGAVASAPSLAYLANFPLARLRW